MQSNEEMKIMPKSSSELDESREYQKNLSLERATLKRPMLEKPLSVELGLTNANFPESKGKKMVRKYKSSIQNMYDDESPSYVAGRPWMDSYLFQRITQSISSWLKEFSKNCLILNVGCGPGWLEKHICGKLRASEFIAIDISRNMGRMTKNRVPEISVILADGEHLPFKAGVFDAILSSRAIKYLDVNRFLSQANQALTDEGSIGILYDCGDNLWLQFLERIGRKMDPGIHERTMRTSDLEAELIKQKIEIQDIVRLTWLPPTIFYQFPRSFYGLIAFFDKPRKRSRIALITGKKKRKVASENKEETVKFAICANEEVEVYV